MQELINILCSPAPNTSVGIEERDKLVLVREVGSMDDGDNTDHPTDLR